MASLLRVVATSCSSPLFSGLACAKLQNVRSVKTPCVRFFRTHQALSRLASPGIVTGILQLLKSVFCFRRSILVTRWLRSMLVEVVFPQYKLLNNFKYCSLMLIYKHNLFYLSRFCFKVWRKQLRHSQTSYPNISVAVHVCNIQCPSRSLCPCPACSATSCVKGPRKWMSVM